MKAVLAFVLIVYGSNAPWMEQHAAEELGTYAEEMGYEVTVVSSDYYESAAPQAQIIVLLGSPETNPLIRELADEGMLNFDGVRNDGFVLKGIAGEIPTLVIGGIVPKGTLNGTYDYLQRFCRCGFFQDGDYVPRSGAFPVADVDLVSNPRFSCRMYSTFGDGLVVLPKYTHRYWDAAEYKRNIDWWAKRKLNGHDLMAYCGTVGGFFEKTAQEVFDLQPASAEIAIGQYYPEAWDWSPEHREDIAKGAIEYGRSVGVKANYWIRLGDVPDRFAKRHPEHRYSVNGEVDASDPAAAELTEKFVGRIIEKFGTDHHYSVGLPQGYGSARNRTAAETIRVLTEIDPDVELIRIDGWDMARWPSGQTRGFLDTLPKDLVNIADNSENMRGQPPFYQKVNYFEGHQWAFALIHDWSGNEWLHGDLSEVLHSVRSIANDPRADNCVGFRMMPHSVAVNTLFWQFISELSWNPDDVTVEEFLRDYATRRYGEGSAERMYNVLQLEAAAMGLFGSDAPIVYYRQGQLPTTTRTSMEIQDQELAAGLFGQALEIALEEAPHQIGNKLYENDVVDLARMALGCSVDVKLADFVRAAGAGDAVLAEGLASDAMRALEQIRDIFSTREDYSLVKQIDRIMSVAGTNPNTPRYIRWRYLETGTRAPDSLELLHCYYIPRVRELLGRKLGQQVTRVGDLRQQWIDGDWEVPREVYFRGTTVEAVQAAVDYWTGADM